MIAEDVEDAITLVLVDVVLIVAMIHVMLMVAVPTAVHHMLLCHGVHAVRDVIMAVTVRVMVNVAVLVLPVVRLLVETALERALTVVLVPPIQVELWNFIMNSKNLT